MADQKGVPMDIFLDPNQIESNYDQLLKFAQSNKDLQENLQHMNAKKNMSLKELIRTPIGFSIIIFLITMIILFLANPPMTQSKDDTRLVEGQQSLPKMLIFSGASAGLVFLVLSLTKK